MLKLSSHMDKDTMIVCLLNSWCAVDENCGTLDRDSNPFRLRRSNGHRKYGRPTKYYLQGTGEINAPMFKAYSDEEAVTLANEYINALTPS
jgi:hypothetical protein